MKRAFYLTFGFLAMLIGFGVAVWIFYNLFVERQPGYTGRASLFPLAMIGCGVYWLKKGWKAGARKDTPESSAPSLK
jgi:hypothetical protein